MQSSRVDDGEYTLLARVEQGTKKVVVGGIRVTAGWCVIDERRRMSEGDEAGVVMDEMDNERTFSRLPRFNPSTRSNNGHDRM